METEDLSSMADDVHNAESGYEKIWKSRYYRWFTPMDEACAADYASWMQGSTDRHGNVLGKSYSPRARRGCGPHEYCSYHKDARTLKHEHSLVQQWRKSGSKVLEGLGIEAVICSGSTYEALPRIPTERSVQSDNPIRPSDVLLSA